MNYKDIDRIEAEEVADRVKRRVAHIDDNSLRRAVAYFSHVANSKRLNALEPDFDLPVSERIIVECSNEFGVPISNIKSTSRFAAAWDARHCAIMLMRVAGMSLNEIAAALYKKRPNIAYAIKAMRNRMETEPVFAARVGKIAKAAGVMIPFQW